MTEMNRRRFLSAASAAAAGCLAPRLFAGQRPPAEPPPPGPVAVGNNEFGFDLYGQLRAKSGNVFVSPFSITAALAMTATGARGATRDEMLKVLHLPAESEKTDAEFKSLMARVNGAGVPADKRGYQLTTANAIWAQQGYPWRPEFKDRVTGNYGAGLIDTDFRADPEAARKRINAWVEKETRDKIKDLIGPGVIDRMTRMVLANAIYFKGDWAAQFDKKLTKDQPFTLAGGGKQNVPLMHRSGGYRLYQDATLQVLELPYKGNELAMDVLLPRKPDGLPALEKGLSAGTVAGWVGKLRSVPDVQVYLPRFKVETEYELSGPLKALGMRSAFGDADFSGMHSGPEQLYISAVVHKAYADVNEEGTEAAAATGVVMKATSAVVGGPPVFRADHPFLFQIRHVPTGAVLFLGRYEKP